MNLYLVVLSITKKERMELKNVEDRFPTIFCMTFLLYNCIRKRPCKRKLKRKIATKLLNLARDMCYFFAIVAWRQIKLTFPRELGMDYQCNELELTFRPFVKRRVNFGKLVTFCSWRLIPKRVTFVIAFHVFFCWYFLFTAVEYSLLHQETIPSLHVSARNNNIAWHRNWWYTLHEFSPSDIQP